MGNPSLRLSEVLSGLVSLNDLFCILNKTTFVHPYLVYFLHCALCEQIICAILIRCRYIYMPSIEKEPIYDVYCISRHQYQRFLNILFWGWLSGAVGSVDVWCSARRCCRGRGFESR